MASLEQFSSLVANIYDAALDPAQWDQTLRLVCSVTGGNNSALVLYDREKQRRPHIIAANFDPLQNRRYDEYFSRIDPLAPILERSPPGVVVTARSVTQESQRCGEFYNDWARPNETGDTVFVNLTAGDEGVCTFMVGHVWGPEPFPTPKVLRLARLLAPHLERALRVQSELGDLSLVHAGALDLIDQWRHGCVLISSTGAVLYANRAANQVADHRMVSSSALVGWKPRFRERTLRCSVLFIRLGPTADGRRDPEVASQYPEVQAGSRIRSTCCRFE